MQIRIEPWSLPADAHDPCSPYVERFWLPVLGPTGFVTLRALAARLDGAPNGFIIDVATISACIGVGKSDGTHAPLRRTLTRLERFGLVALRAPNVYAVRTRIPWLPPRLERRLPEQLRVAHGRERTYAHGA